MAGYIKLFRSMLDWEWMSDSKTVSVFLYCLLSANHVQKKWHGVTIEPGQFITSLQSIQSATHLTQRSIRTALNNLKTTGEVTIKTTNRFSLITVANWAFYQSGEGEASSKTTRETTIKRQSNDNNQECKERKKDIRGDFEVFWRSYPKKASKPAAMKAFQKINPSDSLLSTILEKLEKHKRSAQWQKDAGQYVPNPATWLNNRRWEDEIGGEPIGPVYKCVD